MKLEFLADGCPDCPIIRLYEFNLAEAVRLSELFDCLATGNRQSIALHEEPWIVPIKECHLDLHLDNKDLGVVQKTPSMFDCILTVDGWSNIVGLVEPFCKSEKMFGHYQWLNEDGETSLLLSPNGQW